LCQAILLNGLVEFLVALHLNQHCLRRRHAAAARQAVIQSNLRGLQLGGATITTNLNVAPVSLNLDRGSLAIIVKYLIFTIAKRVLFCFSPKKVWQVTPEFDVAVRSFLPLSTGLMQACEGAMKSLRSVKTNGPENLLDIFLLCSEKSQRRRKRRKEKANLLKFSLSERTKE